MALLIGKTIATEKAPATIDNFFFWTKSTTILHPFDVVKVHHLNDSDTFGVVEEISHVTDSASFLANYISNDFGDAEVEENTFRINMNYVKVKVVHNTKQIDTPVLSDSQVYLASREEVQIALGLKEIRNPIVCGYLDMYEDAGEGQRFTLPVSMNADFLIGPEGAHLNISGISGLASKTSYAMFLLRAIQQQSLSKISEEDHADEGGVAIVAFNVKGRDLLALDEANAELGEKDKKLYEEMGMQPTPFQQVKYLYPFSNSRSQNSYVDKDRLEKQMRTGRAIEYKFDYEKDKYNLDLMFSNIDDSTQTMESIISSIVNESGKFGNITEWNRFLDVLDEMGESGKGGNKEISVLSWRKFSRVAKKSIANNCLFDTIFDEKHQSRIGDEIQKIRENDVYVIDMAKLDSNMQAFVFGTTMREITDYQLGEKKVAEDGKKPPSRIIIFIDELNKYASSESPKNSPILHQILDIAERGRSLGIVLFGAEQFMSAIHNRVAGNCANMAYGRTNAIEIAKSNYRYIPKVYQNMMTRLKPGEYLLQSFSFNSLLHIKFPMPVYRQFK